MNPEIIDHVSIRPLRFRVLWPHKSSVVECVLAIDTALDTFHCAVKQHGEVVACCTLYPESCERFPGTGVYRLRAMATAPEVRGQGAGKRMLQFALEECVRRGAQLVWCDARLKAVPFYHALGFDALPEVYEVPLIGPHQFMWKILDHA